MKKYFFIAASLICLLPFFGSAEVFAAGIRVGVYDNEPLVFTDEGGKVKGLFIDVLEYIAKKEGWKLKYVPGSLFECLSRLEKGEIDLMTTIAFSHERALRFDFTYRSVLTNWGQVYTGKSARVESVLDLAGRKVAVIKGDIHNRALQKLTEAFGIECRFIEADEKDLIFELIENNVVDAGAVNRLYGIRRQKAYDVRKSGLIYNPIEIRYAVPKGRNEDLLSTIDRYLLLLKKDSGSIYHSAVNRWLVSGHESVFPVWMLWGVAAACVLLLFFLVNGLVLRARVKARTADLAVNNRKLTAEISQRERVEGALRESEERFRQFFEEDLSGAFIARPDGSLVACNPAFASIFGYPSVEEAMEMTLDMVSPDTSPSDNFLSRLQREKKLRFYESTLKGPAGNTIHVIENAVGVFDDRGRLTEIKGCLIDLTEKKMLETQLFQASKMEAIGTLAGGIAHDFNNILAAIIGYAELGRIDLSYDHPAKSRLDQILKAGHRAKEIVMQILAFSRRSESARRPLKVAEVIGETLKLLRASLPSTIEIVEDIEDTDSLVMANATQMHQVLMNLCTNAKHAVGDEGGVIGVSLAKASPGDSSPGAPDLSPGNYLKLSVSDTGGGIDEAVIERIFDPYFTTKEVGKGTGMGLAVVHGIVNIHGGAVTVRSEKGRGSVFTVYLPETSEQEQPAEEEKGKTPKGNERILLVDDEAFIIDVGKEMLECLGYRITTATEPMRALELFRADPEGYDLIITDLTMPVMTGDRLATEIRQIRPRLPVIICSGVLDHGSMENTDVAGFISKPFKLDQLAGMVRKSIDMGG